MEAVGARRGEEPEAVVLVFRHGARGPSKNALKQLGLDAATREWDPDEVDALTERGAQQARALGAEAQRWLPRRVRGAPPTKHVWRSSTSARVLESGRAFWEGFCEALDGQPGTAASLEPLAYEPPLDAGCHFRAWHYEPPYLEHVKSVKTSKVLADKAEAEAETLRPVRAHVLTEDLPETALYKSTYVHELIECERYDVKERDAVRRRLEESQVADVERLALWCWNERFFMKHRPELRELIGGRLRADVVKWLAGAAGDDADAPRFAAYSSHDYTLLSLLTALNVPDYPVAPLSFASYTLFKLWADGTVTCELNVAPFLTPDKRPVDDLQTHAVKTFTFQLDELICMGDTGQ